MKTDSERRWSGANAVSTILFLALFVLGAATAGSMKNSSLGSEWDAAQGVTYENLSVFPVVARQGADTSGYETLDEALASGDVVITEQGGEILRRTRGPIPMPVPYGGAQVNQLVFVNRGKRPVILLAGEIVSGGKQDRVIGKDRVVPVGAEPLPLDVFCVEHGRWTGMSAQFAAAKTMVHPSVRERAAVDEDQGEVWAAVLSGSTSGGQAGGTLAGTGGGVPGAPAVLPRLSGEALSQVIVESAPTQSYRKIYQSPQVGGSVESFAAEVERRFERAKAELKGERVIGVVVAYGGEVAWSDVFASSQLFERYWPKLLRSYVVEALARPTTQEHASLNDAHVFLEKLSGHQREESEPGVYIWRERSSGHLAEIELEALAPKPITLHWLKVLRTS